MIDRFSIYSRVSRFICSTSLLSFSATCVLIDSRYLRCKSWILTSARADYMFACFVEFCGLAYFLMRLSTVAASWTINGNCWVNNLLYKWCFSAQKFVSYVQTVHLYFMSGHRYVLESTLCVRICEAWCSDTDCWTRFHFAKNKRVCNGCIIKNHLSIQ